MNENNNHVNANNDDSQVLGNDVPINDVKINEASKLNAIDSFPEWLDEQLAIIELKYVDFSTGNSRRGYFGRKE